MPPNRAALLLLLTALVACSSSEERERAARARLEAALANTDRAAAVDAVEDLRAELPETPETDLEMARQLARVGELSRARWLLEAAALRHPDRKELKTGLAEVLLLLSDDEGALRALDSVEAGDPEYPYSLLLRGKAQLDLGDLAGGLATFENAEALAPDWTLFRIARIEVLVDRRQFAPALELIEDARSRDDLPEAQRGWFESAEASMRRELGEQDEPLAMLEARIRADPADVDAWQRRVALLAELQRLEEATEALEAAIAARPDVGEFYPLLAYTHFARGDAETGEAALRRRVEHAFDVVAVRSLVEFLVRGDRAGEAAIVVGEALKRYEGKPSVELGYLHVTLLLRADEYEEARAEFDAFKRRHPRHPRTEYLRARFEFADGDVAAAAARLAELAPRLDASDVHHWLALALEAQGDFDAAEFRYGLALVRDPNQTASRFALIDLLSRRGAWEQVVQHAQAVLKIDPANPRALAAGVRAQLARGLYPAAEAVLRPHVELFPDSLEATVLLSMALRSQGRGKAALEVLDAEATRFAGEAEWLAERAIVLGLLGRVDEGLALVAGRDSAPDFAVVQNARAFLLLSSGRAAEGQAAAERALALDPANPLPLRLVGDHHSSRGEFAAAVGAYKRYLAMRPADAEVLFRLGVARERSGDTAGAIEAYRAAADRDSVAAAPRNHLALALAGEGRLEEALAAAQAAYARAESDPAILDTLGWLYLRADRPDRAVALLERARDAAPDAADSRYHLAIAYRDQGRTAEARELLNDLHEELDSDHDLRARVGEALVSLP